MSPGARAAFGQAFFQRSPQTRFETEGIVDCGERAAGRWVYQWVYGERRGHIPEAELVLAGGLVAEKLSCLKR